MANETRMAELKEEIGKCTAYEAAAPTSFGKAAWKQARELAEEELARLQRIQLCEDAGDD